MILGVLARSAAWICMLAGARKLLIKADEVRPREPSRRVKHARFSIEFPRGWLAGERSGAVVAEGPGGLQAEVRAEALPKGDVQKYFEKSLAGLGRTLKDFEEVSRGEARLGGASARWAILSHKAGSRRHRTLRYWVLGKGGAYSLVFSAEPQRFEGLLPDFREAAATFQPS